MLLFEPAEQLREVMEPEKVEQLLKRPDLTYRDIAIALEQSGDGGFSQLKALFRQQLGGMGSPPDNAELARLWLASDQFDAGITAKSLESELQDLLHSRWGLGLPANATLPDWRQRAQRALLLREFLHDWHGDELTAFAKQSLPVSKAAEELGLRELISSERPGVLGAIDTFPCEEQFLLRSVDAFLAMGAAAKAQKLSWRRLQWELARTAASLGLAIDQAEALLPKPTAPVEHWLTYQTDLAHHVDGLQRRLEQQVAELNADAVEVAQGLEQLLDKQTQRFTDAFQQAGWLIPGAMAQTRIWAERVQPGAGRAVVFWVDALRYEMGASLHERSFAVTEGDGEPCSVVDGVPVGWSNDKARRLAHLQQRVPAAVVLNLVEVIRSKEAVLLEKLAGNGPVVITSIGIDEAGERDSDERLANVRADMQRELDTIEEAVRRLAALPLEQPLERFVITADHGFLHLPLGREPAMRIPAPAGKTFKLERRCWLGHPSAVQEPCIEIPPAELGYGSNGLSVVVPRSAGVLKAGGSLWYHHGGTSVQEVLIPLLSLRCNPAGTAEENSKAPKAKRSKRNAWPGELPEKITNRILMLPIELPVDLIG